MVIKVLLIPGGKRHDDVFYLCAFSDGAKIEFSKAVYFVYLSVLMIPDGTGICMVNIASQVFVLSRENSVIMAFDMYAEHCFLIDGYEQLRTRNFFYKASGRRTTTHRPLVG